MNLTHDLFNNSAAMRGAYALTIGFKYTYGDLVNNIKEYANILRTYKDKGINRIAIITDEQLDFNTISLFYALIQCEITPIIINSEIGEQTNGILAENGVDIVLYNTLKKPDYLKPYCIGTYGASDSIFKKIVNPNMPVDSKRKIDDFKKYLDYTLKNQPEEDIVCKLYDKKYDKIKEEVIKSSDISDFDCNFKELDFGGKWQTGETTLPLYDREGFLYLTGALCNCMHLICLKKCNMEKNILKILKEKPSIIALDEYILLELSINEKFQNIDLSFAKKVISDVDENYMCLFYDILHKIGFKGTYMRLAKESDNEKVFLI